MVYNALYLRFVKICKIMYNYIYRMYSIYIYIYIIYMHGLVVPSDFVLKRKRCEGSAMVARCVLVWWSPFKWWGVELTEKWIAPSIWWDEVHSPEVNPLTAAPCSAMPKNLCTKITTECQMIQIKSGILQLLSA